MASIYKKDTVMFWHLKIAEIEKDSVFASRKDFC